MKSCMGIVVVVVLWVLGLYGIYDSAMFLMSGDSIITKAIVLFFNKDNITISPIPLIVLFCSFVLLMIAGYFTFGRRFKNRS